MGIERGGPKGGTMNYKKYFPMSEDDGLNGGGAEPTGEPTEGQEEPKSFDDLLKDGYQSEFDRRVTKAINTAVSKERARLEALHNQQLTEAEKLAKMTEEEKNEYKAQQKEAEIRRREDAITKRELMAEAKEKLVERGLPLNLANNLIYDSAETVKNSLDDLEKAFNEAVAKTVEDKLKGGQPPKDAGSVGEKGKDKAREAEVRKAFGL